MLCVWVACGLLSAAHLPYNFSRNIADFTRFHLLQILIKGFGIYEGSSSKKSKNVVWSASYFIRDKKGE